MQRHDCKDFVTIYSTKTWKPEVAIAVPTTDLADVAWSPDNCCLLVWDTLLAYKALVYASDGELLASYQAYSDGLGIKSTSWSPSGQMLALGSFDQVRHHSLPCLQAVQAGRILHGRSAGRCVRLQKSAGCLKTILVVAP